MPAVWAKCEATALVGASYFLDSDAHAAQLKREMGAATRLDGPVRRQIRTPSARGLLDVRAIGLRLGAVRGLNSIDGPALLIILKT